MHDAQTFVFAVAGLGAGISCWAVSAFQTKRLSLVAVEKLQTKQRGSLATYRQMCSLEAPRSAMPGHNRLDIAQDRV
jgi:hypothetical protein